MRSIVTVTVPASERRLTTVERVKLELGLTTGEHDALLQAKIDEATSDIEAHCSRVFCRETVSERFLGVRTHAWSHYDSGLALSRWPVVSIVSITEDDDAVIDYLLDAEAGMLFSTDAAGAVRSWSWSSALVVEYEAGYLLPGEASRNLPAVLEAACVELVQSHWFSRGRDPMVRGEDVPGLGSVQYWVGAVGQSGELPPSVTSKIEPFKRRVFA